VSNRTYLSGVSYVPRGTCSVRDRGTHVPGRCCIHLADSTGGPRSRLGGLGDRSLPSLVRDVLSLIPGLHPILGGRSCRRLTDRCRRDRATSKATANVANGEIAGLLHTGPAVPPGSSHRFRSFSRPTTDTGARRGWVGRGSVQPSALGLPTYGDAPSSAPELRAAADRSRSRR